MLDLWNHLCLSIGDFLLGWTLDIGTDFALIVLALLTTAIMLSIRVLTTNQDWLKRVFLDRGRLKEKIREAKKAGDKPARDRYRLTFNQLGLKKLGAEFVPLLLVLVPVAILATWALQRLEFHPVRSKETFQATAYFPVSYQGEVVHLAPLTTGWAEKGTGWVQAVTARPNEPDWWDRLLRKVGLQDDKPLPPDILAKWSVLAWSDPLLQIRTRDGTLTHPVQVGGRYYSEPIKEHESGVVTQIHLREVKLFDLVPGLGGMFPGWLVGYLLLVLPLVPLAKKVIGVY